ncbi:hypothetical protein [Acidibrevibacterium fodinaquatile]|uniref:hypothetical protein n=1 Tax=Acidibrevibacterium fodinaquatile TaxID=1969806 RepID=UPI0013B3E4E8|nr:hypothetical protein [Acidibrevibacterium fodinaquatile]
MAPEAPGLALAALALAGPVVRGVPVPARPEGLQERRAPPGMAPGRGMVPSAWSRLFPRGMRKYLRRDQWPWFIPRDRSAAITPHTVS